VRPAGPPTPRKKITQDRWISSPSSSSFPPFHHSLQRASDDRARPMNNDLHFFRLSFNNSTASSAGSVAEWLACWTQAQKGPGSTSNRSRDAIG